MSFNAFHDLFAPENSSEVPYPLLSLFNRKCDRIDYRGRKYKLAPIDRPALWRWFYELYLKAFRCGYCDVELTYDSADQERVFSFDHVVPISKGGDNSVGNLELACNPCNAVKSRMNAGTFQKMVELGEREFILQVYRDQKEDYAPKVETNLQCDTCKNFRGNRCSLGIDIKTAFNRDSDWCGRWNA